MQLKCPNGPYPDLPHAFDAVAFEQGTQTSAHIYCRQCGEIRALVNTPPAINEDDPAWPSRHKRKRADA